MMAFIEPVQRECMTVEGHAELPTLMAKRSPVVRFLARYTRPNAPLLMGLMISNSSMDIPCDCPLVLATGVVAPAQAVHLYAPSYSCNMMDSNAAAR